MIVCLKNLENKEKEKLKLIHCADIHLGSKMEAKLPREKAEERRGEVRATFHRMVEFAKREQVRAILLSGDIFLFTIIPLIS